MKQLGDYIVQTDILPKEAIRRVLMEQVKQVTKNMELAPEVYFSFNTPYEAFDPESGERVSGFLSSWKTIAEAV